MRYETWEPSLALCAPPYTSCPAASAASLLVRMAIERTAMFQPRLTFHGAAKAVTGSCFRLETEHGQKGIGLFSWSTIMKP